MIKHKMLKYKSNPIRMSITYAFMIDLGSAIIKLRQFE